MKFCSCIDCPRVVLDKLQLKDHHQKVHQVAKLIEINKKRPVIMLNDIKRMKVSTSPQPPELNPEGESTQTSEDNNDNVDMEGDSYETCLTCGDAIAGSDILVHITTHLQPGQTDCLHCDFEASQIQDLLDHMTVHYGLKAYACTIQGCGKAYHWKHSLARHMSNSHSVGNAYQCSSCDESFATLREERRHALTHITTDGEAVSTTGTDDDALDTIKKKHLRPHQCQQCDKRFVKRKQLKAHEAIHAKHAEAGTTPNFIAVRRVHQPVYAKPRRKKNNESSSVVMDTEKRACKTCGEEMILSELLIHIKTHVSKDQRQCELCQHVYANVESLREHMHTHYGLEPHKCTICHKTYSLKQSVLNHIIRNHKAVKPLEFYACTIPSTPKAMKEAATIYPKKYKNGKLAVFTPPLAVVSPPSSTVNYGSPTPVSTSTHFSTPVQQQLQFNNTTTSPFATRTSFAVTPSTSSNNNTPSSENGFTKKMKPINFQCNFCNRVFTTKFSVQRHEAKLHNYVEENNRRVYKTTYATAEDSSDAYGMELQPTEPETVWVDGKYSIPDFSFSYSNGSSFESRNESLRSEITHLLFHQDLSEHSSQDIVFKEIPTNLY